jgi:hypothetical protein
MLLAALPCSISAHFTFHLTYHGGITDNLWALLQECFLHSMGPGPFANMIHTHHVHHYEVLKLQYLELVYAQMHAAEKLLANFQVFSDFDDWEGYAGFTPSANYFCCLHCKLMNTHVPVIDQHMAMLSAHILEIDHSFKVFTLLHVE